MFLLASVRERIWLCSGYVVFERRRKMMMSKFFILRIFLNFLKECLWCVDCSERWLRPR